MSNGDAAVLLLQPEPGLMVKTLLPNRPYTHSSTNQATDSTCCCGCHRPSQQNTPVSWPEQHCSAQLLPPVPEQLPGPPAEKLRCPLTTPAAPAAAWRLSQPRTWPVQLLSSWPGPRSRHAAAAEHCPQMQLAGLATACSKQAVQFSR